jgi:AP-5 complex subunit beta-1
MAANSRARSVKLLEVPADFLIQASEQYLAPFVVSVIGEPLVNMIKDGGIIRNIIWKGSASDSFLDSTTSATALERGPLHLTYGDDRDGSGS